MHSRDLLVDAGAALKGDSWRRQPRDPGGEGGGQWVSGGGDFTRPAGREGYWQRLTAEQQKALASYKGEGYKRINGRLRKGAEVAGRVTTNLDFAVEKGRIERDSTLYRAMSLPEGAPEDLVGKTLKDEGFVSTTEKREIAEDFIFKIPKRPALARVKVAAGTPAAFPSRPDTLEEDWEREAILPRGSSFRVTAVAREGRLMVVDMEPVDIPRRD